jgi:hypothetical protein
VDVSRLENERGHSEYQSTVLAVGGFVAVALLLGGHMLRTALARYADERRAHEAKLTRLGDFYTALSQSL